MAHFAEIDSNNVVLRVIVVHNNECKDENGVEHESLGINFCKNLLGGNWIQTSYNSSFRKHYAGEGYTYDEALDAFLPPKPYPSWILNTETFLWEAPIPSPGFDYTWNEDLLVWEEKLPQQPQ